VVWQFIQEEHFHPWVSLPVNAGVWWWCTETASYGEREQRVQEWIGIHHEDYIHISARQIKNSWTQHKRWNWIWKTIKIQLKIYPLHWSDLWKLYPTLSMYTGIQWCVCMLGTKIHDRSQKLMFGGALSFLQSLKGWANRFPDSMVMWDIGSPFYWKWALMQWTLPSSFEGHKMQSAPVCWKAVASVFCVARSSALYSYFEIQKRMWTYVVTCHTDCIRLLAGRGMNMRYTLS
jgi:hypothetical protein